MHCDTYALWYEMIGRELSTPTDTKANNVSFEQRVEEFSPKIWKAGRDYYEQKSRWEKVGISLKADIKNNKSVSKRYESNPNIVIEYYYNTNTMWNLCAYMGTQWNSQWKSDIPLW